ncbi:MAG: hypothetical protein M3N16_05500 [Actinomycetota bacterium]|nr:hypothetical protein [Actinomycetota bacterium]
MASSQRGGPSAGRSGGLIERIRRLRRFRPREVDGGPAARVEGLERRLEHLEATLEGLQDAVHREAVRRNEQISELRQRTEPGEMARVLSDDARRRGI